MPANTFSKGRDCQLVLIGPAGANGRATTATVHVVWSMSPQCPYDVQVVQHLADMLGRNDAVSGFELGRVTRKIDEGAHDG